MHALMLPRLGQTMTKGKLIEWLVDVGQSYQEGTPIYSVETDKTVLDVEATVSGALLCQIVRPDEEVPVGACMGVSADGGEMPSEAEIVKFLERQVLEAAQVGVRESAVALSSARGDGEDSQAVERPRAMPNVRLRAKELGVDLWELIAATGKSGLITREDVEAFAERRIAEPKDTAQPGARREGLKAAMAEHMTRSWTVPQFVQDMEVDTAPLRGRVDRLLSEGLSVSFGTLILDALVQALRVVPLCNGVYENGTFVQHTAINVGIAVATESGLLVPVLRNCEEMDLRHRAAAMGTLVQRTRAGALTPDDMTEGTVTLSVLNNTRVETGAPILNAPQVCLLFCGGPVRKPVVRGDHVVAGETVHFAAVYDHRVIDGATGARFLDALYEAIAAS